MTSDLLSFLPVWAEYLIKGIIVLVLLVSGGVAIGKMGRHPIWALLLVLPWVPFIVFWLAAYTRWPFVPRDSD